MKINLTLLGSSKIKLLKAIAQAAQDLDMQAYLVGGAVRDLLLRRPTKDLDVLIVGNACKVAQNIAKLVKAKLVTHLAFRTATLHFSQMNIDLATARKETYARPGALPKIKPSTLKEDLFRRDFTVNAMAVSLNSDDFGKLEDHFGGLKDLKKKQLRILHKESFVDDPTRILRGIRYQQRLGFNFEKETLNHLQCALREGAFATVKPQRIIKELV